MMTRFKSWTMGMLLTIPGMMAQAQQPDTVNFGNRIGQDGFRLGVGLEVTRNSTHGGKVKTYALGVGNHVPFNGHFGGSYVSQTKGKEQWRAFGYYSPTTINNRDNGQHYGTDGSDWQMKSGVTLGGQTSIVGIGSAGEVASFSGKPILGAFANQSVGILTLGSYAGVEAGAMVSVDPGTGAGIGGYVNATYYAAEQFGEGAVDITGAADLTGFNWSVGLNLVVPLGGTELGRRFN